MLKIMIRYMFRNIYTFVSEIIKLLK